jgi:hypothetical protein
MLGMGSEPQLSDIHEEKIVGEDRIHLNAVLNRSVAAVY